MSNSPLLGQVEVRRGNSNEVLQERASGDRLGVVRNGQDLVERSTRSGTVVEDEHGDGGGSVDTDKGYDDLSTGIGVLGGKVFDGGKSGGDLSSVVVDEATPDLTNRVSSHGELGHDTL